MDDQQRESGQIVARVYKTLEEALYSANLSSGELQEMCKYIIRYDCENQSDEMLKHNLLKSLTDSHATIIVNSFSNFLKKRKEKQNSENPYFLASSDQFDEFIHFMAIYVLIHGGLVVFFNNLISDEKNKYYGYFGLGMVVLNAVRIFYNWCLQFVKKPSEVLLNMTGILSKDKHKHIISALNIIDNASLPQLTRIEECSRMEVKTYKNRLENIKKCEVRFKDEDRPGWLFFSKQYEWKPVGLGAGPSHPDVPDFYQKRRWHKIQSIAFPHFKEAIDYIHSKKDNFMNNDVYAYFSKNYLKHVDDINLEFLTKMKQAHDQEAKETYNNGDDVIKQKKFLYNSEFADKLIKQSAITPSMAFSHFKEAIDYIKSKEDNFMNNDVYAYFSDKYLEHVDDIKPEFLTKMKQAHDQEAKKIYNKGEDVIKQKKFLYNSAFADKLIKQSAIAPGVRRDTEWQTAEIEFKERFLYTSKRILGVLGVGFALLAYFKYWYAKDYLLIYYYFDTLENGDNTKILKIMEDLSKSQANEVIMRPGVVFKVKDIKTTYEFLNGLWLGTGPYNLLFYASSLTRMGLKTGAVGAVLYALKYALTRVLTYFDIDIRGKVKKFIKGVTYLLTDKRMETFIAATGFSIFSYCIYSVCIDAENKIIEDRQKKEKDNQQKRRESQERFIKSEDERLKKLKDNRKKEYENELILELDKHPNKFIAHLAISAVKLLSSSDKKEYDKKNVNAQDVTKFGKSLKSLKSP